VTKAQELAQLGQSIWYDNIRRAELDSGHLKALIDAGVRGVTSNPTIFDKAIAGSTDYDVEMKQLMRAGKSVDKIFETLAIEDIRHAADLLRPVFDQTNGLDGYVSLEVSPKLAHDTDGTIKDARRLFKAVGRPNVMIKVPATPAGIPAIETLIGEGININVTLIFALERYEAVVKAYLAGLEKLLKAGGNLRRVASVASFFVSRVDTAVDKELDKKGNADLRGKIAIANAKVAYALFRKYFKGERWEKLAAQGATVQRPLWASTGTKNPAYPDTLYVDTLIGPHTVNTVPPATLSAFLDHGKVALTLETGVAEAQAQIDHLAKLGIDFKAVTQKLLDDGVAAFAKSFEALMQSIADKRARLLAEAQGRSASLGACQPAVDSALKTMDAQSIMARIWLKDHTVWRPDPAEISNRLGWLDCPVSMVKHLDMLHQLCNEVGADGYTHALVMGMGGSSLAPEVFAKTFGVQTAFFEVEVLDSTDAGAVQAYAARLDPARTLFIVSTKSGGTVETLSFFKYFYNKTVEAVGAEKAGQHFIAITDPGSTLIQLAEQYKFRATLLNDSNIGGRYSALSLFGLVPATLDGLDVYHLLNRAAQMAEACGPAVLATENPGAWLGAVLGELAKEGHDKVTFVVSPEIASFGDWVEQLIAESTGKEGKGILPVVGEPLGAPEAYGSDRLFVQLKLGDDTTHDAALAALEKAGQPVVRLHLDDLYDLGGQYFLWEMAIAVAGYVIGIQPFDQPNVESAKVLARKMVAAYNETGKLPAQTPALTDGAISVYGSVTAKSAVEALKVFLKAAKPGDYVALQAYVQPTPETAAVLQALRLRLRDQLKLATTAGYGPRFLHSTGQLHKGDAGNGLFIQFTSDPLHDAPIPDVAGKPESAMSFGVLKLAQALGDRQALLDNKRRVIRFHLGKEVLMGLERLREGLA
jgi:transaldolase/glucose-6-phosphate isomerase